MDKYKARFMSATMVIETPMPEACSNCPDKKYNIHLRRGNYNHRWYRICIKCGQRIEDSATKNGAFHKWNEQQLKKK